MKIRDALLADAAAIADLATELGYEADEFAIRSRLVRLKARDDQLVLIAVEGDRIAGWMQAFASDVIESGLRVEIAGLVVAKSHRRQGIGRCLITRAEHWANEIGAEAVVVRTNTKREESHKFYPALGYQVTKTQTVFRKQLRGSAPVRSLDDSTTATPFAPSK